MKKILTYVKPFFNIKFLVSFLIPWGVINLPAWIGFGLTLVGVHNTLTNTLTAYFAFLWLPCTPEKLVTIPIALLIHTKFFGKRDEKTRWQLLRLYAQARRDWNKTKQKLRRIFNNARRN